MILPIEKQYELINKVEYVLYSSTKWMVKHLQANELDSAHIIDHKAELFRLLSEVHNNKVEVLINDDDEFNKFFSVIDYLRFSIAGIMIKENTNHSFKDVLVVFYLIIHEFNILEIITALNNVKISNSTDIALKSQILQFIEYIVIYYTKEVLAFKKLSDFPDVAFTNFIVKEKNKFNKIREHIDNFMTKEKKDIKDITIAVNQLMVSLI